MTGSITDPWTTSDIVRTQDTRPGVLARPAVTASLAHRTTRSMGQAQHREQLAGARLRVPGVQWCSLLTRYAYLFAHWAGWSRVLGLLARAAGIGLAGWAVIWGATHLMPVVARMSTTLQVIVGVTVVFEVMAIWFVAYGQYTHTTPRAASRRPARPTTPAAPANSTGCRAICGPRAVAPATGPVTVEVISVSPVGDDPR